MKLRLSPHTLKVVETLVEQPGLSLAGAEIHQRSRVAPATLYPALLSLESAGWVVSCWEPNDVSGAGRPRRRLYRLTAAGLREADGCMAIFNKGVLA